jgi:hypothetical protein
MDLYMCSIATLCIDSASAVIFQLPGIRELYIPHRFL